MPPAEAPIATITGLLSAAWIVESSSSDTATARLPPPGRMRSVAMELPLYNEVRGIVPSRNESRMGARLVELCTQGVDQLFAIADTLVEHGGCLHPGPGDP